MSNTGQLAAGPMDQNRPDQQMWNRNRSLKASRPQNGEPGEQVRRGDPICAVAPWMLASARRISGRLRSSSEGTPRGTEDVAPGNLRTGDIPEPGQPVPGPEESPGCRWTYSPPPPSGEYLMPWWPPGPGHWHIQAADKPPSNLCRVNSDVCSWALRFSRAMAIRC